MVRLLPLLLVLGVASAVATPIDSTGRMVLSEGTYFRVIGMPPSPAPGEVVPEMYQQICLASSYGALVRIGTNVVDVPKDSIVVISVPPDAVTTLRSDRPFRVFTMQDLDGNGEMAAHIPYRSYHTSYVPFSWWQDSYGLDGNLTHVPARTYVIAADTSLTVQQQRGADVVDRTIDADGVWSLDEPLVIDEPPGTGGSRDSTTDPTGTMYSASTPFWIVSGHRKAAVLAYPDGLPSTGPYARAATRLRGNLHDAMIPTAYAGTTFVTTPLLYSPTRVRGMDLSEQGIGDDRGDVVRFIALFDSTVIRATTVRGEQIMTTIDAGERWSATAVESTTVWTASRPVMCAQYGKSYGRITSQAQKPEDDPSVDAGMPLLQIVPDTTFWSDRAVFLAPEQTLNFVNVVCRTSDVATLRLDGRPITGALRRHDVPGTPFTAFSGLIIAGRHTISTTSASARFAAWTYGSLDGLQLGRIYGALASMNFHAPCDDSLIVTSETRPDSVRISFSVVRQDDACGAIAFAFMESIEGGTWSRIGNTLVVTRSTPGGRVSGTALIATESGRYERRTVFLDGTSSVHMAEAAIIVAPNPTDGRVTISTRGGAPLPSTIDVVDALGRTVRTIRADSVSQITIDLSDLSPGVYTLLGPPQTTRIVVR